MIEIIDFLQKLKPDQAVQIWHSPTFSPYSTEKCQGVWGKRSKEFNKIKIIFARDLSVVAQTLLYFTIS